MENKIIIIYQSGSKTGNTKYIAEQIAKQLNCQALDVMSNPNINLEQYNLIGFGSGIYCWHFGSKLRKWIKNIRWSKPEVCKPDAFVFSTQGAKSAIRPHARFNRFLQKKAGITSISGWACQSKAVKTPEALNNLKEWVKAKISVSSETKEEKRN